MMLMMKPLAFSVDSAGLSVGGSGGLVREWLLAAPLPFVLASSSSAASAYAGW